MTGSISGWTEGIILSLVFVAAAVIVVSSFNLMYDKDYALPFNDNSGSQNLFIKYQTTASDQIKGGDVAFDAQNGITLKSSWGLAKDAVTITWGFLSGGWIEQLVNSWNLGEAGNALATGLRIIYFLSLIFALLYGLFKVVL